MAIPIYENLSKKRSLYNFAILKVKLLSNSFYRQLILCLSMW
ncbi:hypothetical protein HJ01_00732 [Flavobacterium frigoris PS1]|uniref:Uncharacterized protein n=1 Tax=Flavobacterium frigoris (strain PS1) TaxID=1086011 RepID=H7FNR1_FLAFP|nr:hypothetical protein HJ01_00732 [Flavobacterium frigoris PS1]